MPEALEDERQRLFSLDTALRVEADHILEQSGLAKVILGAGFQPAGSYIMRTMTWRDLDFERVDDRPDWQEHWELGVKLAQTGWGWRFRCLDAYRDPRNPRDAGYYWGLQVTEQQSGETWKFDLWTARGEEFERAAPKRPLWTSRLTDETRYRILAIKEKVCDLPEYRHSLLSVHIYEAVLEHNIDNINEFQKWWQQDYGQNTASGEFWNR